MKSIEISARTVEDAVNEGLQKLGCSISDCRVDIVQDGAKGLFGVFGSKPAIVRLSLLNGDADDLGINLKDSLRVEAPVKSKRAPAAKNPQEKKTPAEKKPPVEKKPTEKKPAEKSRMRIAANPQVVDRPKSNSVMDRFKSAPLPGQSPAPAVKPVKPARAPKPRTPHEDYGMESHAEAHERVPVPAPEHIDIHDPETLEGRAQHFLLALTKHMGVDVQVEAKKSEDGHLFVSMYGDTLGILIGRRGETLDALQYLTSLQVNRGQEEYTRLTLDTENYRAKREEALTRLAARMANRAVKTGRKVSLEPMNPYERRILHASLQDNPSVTTHSEGDEPYRHVVVVPEK